MPSSPNYVRDYAQEYETSKARGEQVAGHNSDSAKRKRFRRAAVKKGLVKAGDGKDLDHRIPLSKGGPNTLANARPEAPGLNRSFPRNPDGSMKVNHATAKERAKLSD